MKYWAYTNSKIQIGKFYKFNYYSIIVSTIIMFFIESALWYAIFKGKTDLAGITFASMFQYLIFGHILRKFLGSGVDQEIGEAYKDGKIIIDLVKPVNLVAKIFFTDLGRGFMESFAVGTPLLVIWAVGYKLSNFSLDKIILFAVMSLLAYIVFFLINYIVGFICFWTNSIIGIVSLKTAIWGIGAGTFIPLELYPNWLVKIVNVLPFKATYYAPVSVWLNNSKMSESLNMVGLQLMWIAILGVVVYITQKAALKRFVVQGG